MSLSFPHNRVLHSWFSAACLFLASLICATNSNSLMAQEESFLITLRNGDQVPVTLENIKFEWLTVALDGESSTRTLDVNEISQLNFAVQPASMQVAEMRGVIARLGDEKYAVRQAAEERLANEGVPYIKLLEESGEGLDLEHKYRINRLLKFLRKQFNKSKSAKYSLEFDTIVLKSGKKIEGDIGKFAFNCKWKGGDIRLDRKNCKTMTRENAAGKTVFEVVARPAVEVQTEVVDANDAFLNGEDLVDGHEFEGFETDANGDPLPRSTSRDAGEVAAEKGLLLKSGNEVGMAIVAGYKMKRSRSGNRGVTNRYLDTSGGGSKWKPYRGVTRIEFCMPGHPDEAATVNSMSLLLEITKPKHTLIEAFNAAGHIVGTVYCGDVHTSTVGFQTNDHVAYVLLHPNHYFDPPPAKLNFDFAFDDVYFGEPAWAPELNLVAKDEKARKFLLNDGNRMNVKSFQFNKENQSVVFEGSDGIEDFTIPQNDIAWLLGPQQYVTPISVIKAMDKPPVVEPAKAAYAMLKDGSVVRCEFNDGPVIAGSDLKLDPAEIVGVWGGNETARYPQAGDFEFGKMLMVRPLNRIAFAENDIDWKTGTFEFDLKGAKNLEQPVAAYKVASEKDKDGESKDEKAAEIPDGELKNNHWVMDAVLASVLGSEATEAKPISLLETESLWFAAPRVRAADTRLLRLLDGQQYVLADGEEGFKLVELNGDKITIEKQGTKLVLTTDQVAAFEMGK